jgi:hypothetical protein
MAGELAGAYESPGPGAEVAVEGEPRWRRGDRFRAVLFITLGVVYAVLLFPLAVLAFLLWAAGRLLARGDE